MLNVQKLSQKQLFQEVLIQGENNLLDKEFHWYQGDAPAVDDCESL